MEAKFLSRIERELVLQYLIDGNVPVTISPVVKVQDPDVIKPMDSAVVPIAINAEKLSVLKEGIILLEDVPDSVLENIDKEVKVEFYFNRVGLYFVTVLKKVSAGAALVIPENIYRIPDIFVDKKYDFTAQIVISVSNKGTSSFSCLPAD